MSAPDRTAPPARVAVPAAIAVAFLAVPLVALAVRTPWGRAADLLGDPAVRAAVRVSLVSSTAAALLAGLLGIPLAWVLARHRFPGRAMVRTLAVVPLVLPPVVGGVALLLAYGRRGVVGGALHDLFGLTLPFSTTGVVLAQAFVALPFVVVTVESGLAALDPGYEEAAATLGASRWWTLWRVALPLIRPALAAGIGLGWARALGEFGATITFAGNLPGRTQTMPLAVFLLLESDRDAAYLLSLLLLAVSVAVLLAFRGRLLGSSS